MPEAPQTDEKTEIVLPELEKDMTLSQYNIDFDSVKSYWMELTNGVRAKKNIPQYKYSDTLETTAIEWSKIQKSKNTASHKRKSGDSYYNYNKITAWLGAR